MSRNNNSNIIKVRNFNLEYTLESGQIFRINKDNDWYCVNAQDKFFKIKQIRNQIEFYGVNKDFVIDFFSLNVQLPKILKEINKDKYIGKAISSYRGLRLIKQEPWECLISFMCSSASNIPRIKSKLNTLSKYFGKKLLLDGVQSSSFPLPGKINDFRKIRDAKTGFRAKYIFDVNNTIGTIHLSSLRNKPYNHAKDELKKINGIGDKVADCIMLFSLGFNQAFPVDTWIKKVMQLYYFNNNTVSNDRIREFGMGYFGKYAGYAQQYLYLFSRNELT